MKRWAMVVGIGLAAGELAVGATLIRYVSVDGTNNPPYTNWADAATSIKVAVDAANANNAGDVVWVSNGPYQVSATITIGNTKVRGFTGDYRDVLVYGSGNVLGSGCFKMTKPESELSAVTISNIIGTTIGGAVSMFPATVVSAGLLSNCLITSCSAQRGPAFYYQCSSSVVANCVIENNTSTVYGTIYSDGSTCYGPLIYDSLIRNNIAISNSSGGAIRINSPGAVLRNTTLLGNTATSGGGAIYAAYNFTADRCLIASNVAQGIYGGGIYWYNYTYSSVLSNCQIVGNYAANSGGGLAFRPAGGRLYNCLIARNTSNTGVGGGMLCSRYTTMVYNCTIVLNSVPGQNTGGGIYGEAGSGNGIAQVYNTILYSNWLGTASVNSNYNTVWGHVFSNSCTVPLPTNGTGNISYEPGLRDMAAGHYEPAAGSPCIDKGLNNLDWMNDALDLLGRPRLDRFTRQVDMGACEYVYPGSLMSVR